MEPRILAIADELAGELFAEGSPADLVDRYARDCRCPSSARCSACRSPTAEVHGLDEQLHAPHRRSRLPAHHRGLWAMRRYSNSASRPRASHGGEGLIAELVRVEKAAGGSAVTRWCRWSFCSWARDGDHHAFDQRLGPRADAKIRACATGSKRTGAGPIGDRGVSALPLAGAVFQAAPRARRCGARRRPLKRGDRIMAMLAAANMDPAANEHPERLDLARHPEPPPRLRHRHPFLLGPSARAHRGQVRAGGAIQALAEARAGRADQQIRWRERPGLRALAALPVVARAAMSLR